MLKTQVNLKQLQAVSREVQSEIHSALPVNNLHCSWSDWVRSESKCIGPGSTE
jgi:hypothetical protein